MKLFSSFRKPGWQSADARIRAAAVIDEQDPALLAALPGLAIDDPDAQVRRQALRRCADSALYARAMRSDPDRQLQAWAREQWLAAIAAGSSLQAQDLDSLSASEREHLASSAASPALRQQCLDGIQRPAFLAERAVNDPDAGLRQALIERIAEPDLLDRLAEQLRRKDKRLFRQARERAQSLRLAAGDPQARRRQGEGICDRLEQLMRTPLDADEKTRQLEQCRLEWTQLVPDELPPLVQVRFQGLTDVVQAQLQPVASRPALAGAGFDDDDEASDGDQASVETQAAATPSPEEIAARVQLEATLARNAAEIARERELAAQRERELRERQQRQGQLLDQLSRSLEAGDLATARQQVADLEPGTLTGATHRRWQALQPRLRELQGWESWANNKVRTRLCADIERLVGSGLHPDALSHRINEIKEQWRQLDQLEGRDDNSPPTGLDQRLRAACARALKPAREFFDKRQTLRNELTQTLQSFLEAAESRLGGRGRDQDKVDDAAAEATADAPADTDSSTAAATTNEEGPGAGPGAGDGQADSADVNELLALQKQAIEHLRSLDQLAAPQRKRLAGRLRAMLDAIKARLEAAFEQAERGRDALIDAAGKLSEDNDGRQLAQHARRLQERWQAVGPGRRSRDQQQWRQFRSVIDQAFARLDQQRAEQKAAVDQRRQEAGGLVQELEQLATLTGAELSGSDAAVRQLRERWQGLAVADRGLADRYDNALTRHRLAMQDLARDRVRQQRLDLLEASDQQPAAAQSPTQSQAQALAQARSLVFEAEALCDIAAPEAEREARRHWQMERLQARMSGALASGGEDSSALMSRVLEQWAGISGLSSADREQFAARLRRVIDSL